jgi:REP element-mobilizing transposase RayT
MRLAGYDYALEGGYFVTLCARKRLCLFGEVDGGLLRPNEAGRMLTDWWGELPGRFAGVALDEFVVMPNHLHGVVLIVEARAGDERVSLPRVMQWFKTMTTNAYIRGVKQSGWPAFPGKLWQRGYYDHIIRDEKDMARIREYIAGNPANWAKDDENPNRGG